LLYNTRDIQFVWQYQLLHYITLTIYSGLSRVADGGDVVIKQCLGKIAEINKFSAFDEML